MTEINKSDKINKSDEINNEEFDSRVKKNVRNHFKLLAYIDCIHDALIDLFQIDKYLCVEVSEHIKRLREGIGFSFNINGKPKRTNESILYAEFTSSYNYEFNKMLYQYMNPRIRNQVVNVQNDKIVDDILLDNVLTSLSLSYEQVKEEVKRKLSKFKFETSDCNPIWWEEIEKMDDVDKYIVDNINDLNNPYLITRFIYTRLITLYKLFYKLLHQYEKVVRMFSRFKDHSWSWSKFTQYCILCFSNNFNDLIIPYYSCLFRNQRRLCYPLFYVNSIERTTVYEFIQSFNLNHVYYNDYMWKQRYFIDNITRLLITLPSRVFKHYKMMLEVECNRVRVNAFKRIPVIKPM